MPSPPPPPTQNSTLFTGILDTNEVPAFKRHPAASSADEMTVASIPTGQPTIKDLITEAFQKGYSDVHVGVGEEPRFRNRGEIETTNYPTTDRLTFQCWLQELLNNEEICKFEETLDFDGATV
jgi:twitching motility protein PilT